MEGRPGMASNPVHRDGGKRCFPNAARDAVMLSRDMAGAIPASREADAARCPPTDAILRCRAAKVRSH